MSKEIKYNEFVSLMEDNKTASMKYVAGVLGINPATAYRYKAKWKEEITESINPLKNTHKVDGDTAQSTINGNSPLTVDEVAPLFKVDLKEWKAKSVTTNSWDVTNKNGDVFKNYQTKILWQRITMDVDYDILLKQFIKNASSYSPPKSSWAPRPSMKGAEYLIIFPVYDCHINKLAWADETGENYDSKIAAKRIYKSFEDLTCKVAPFKAERVVLEIGGDILHVDNLDNATTGGTPQDVDGRVQKSFTNAVKIFTTVIDRLLLIADVDVVCVSGNHDAMMSFGLYQTLMAWYRFNDRVNIDCGPKLRKYYRYHNNLIGVTHGDMSVKKIKELPMIMASEAAELWGKCAHREWHIGHLHSQKSVNYTVEEDDFCMVRRMPSLASPDSWHYAKGFVGTRKGQNAYVVHRDAGVIACLESTVSEEK